MKIAILTMGTRGDVQPFAVLGQALQQRGHEVTFSTARNFESLVQSYGLRFAPIDADFQAVLNSKEGKKLLKANPLVIRRNLNKWIYPMVEQSLNTFFRLAKQNDKTIYHVKTMADYFADQMPGKMIRAMVVPAVQPTQDFANPAFSGFRIYKFLNRMSYQLNNIGYRLMKKPIVRFRKANGLPEKYVIPEMPFIYGISSIFLKQPTDYPSQSWFTGFWIGHSADMLSPELSNFLQSGTPPLLFTFGSMPFKCKFDIQQALNNLTERFGIRIILIKGWGFEQTERLKDNDRITVIDSAPYDKLLPLVRAVVHHGGLGTTAACLAAGKPFWISPVFYPVGDQFFWGKVSWQMGVSPKPIPLSRLSEAQFIVSIAELLQNKQLYYNAETMAKKLDEEDGISTAVRLIETL